MLSDKASGSLKVRPGFAEYEVSTESGSDRVIPQPNSTELRQVCQYACDRKETSRAGSVLILRFLHGYYPREIAQIMRATSGQPEGLEIVPVVADHRKRAILQPSGLP